MIEEEESELLGYQPHIRTIMEDIDTSIKRKVVISSLYKCIMFLRTNIHTFSDTCRCSLTRKLSWRKTMQALKARKAFAGIFIIVCI